MTKMYDGPCTDCGAVLGGFHQRGCKYAVEGRVGISGSMALRGVRDPLTNDRAKIGGDGPALKIVRDRPQRTIDERLARLRTRLKELTLDDPANDVRKLRAVMLGLLDLLDDAL